jgi:uncharacterized protein (DUF58 family)
VIAQMTQIVDAASWLQQQPWLILILVVLPLLLLARYTRTYPHLPLVFLILAPALLTFALLANADVLLLIVVLDVVVAIVAAADVMTLPRRSLFTAERQAGRIASLRKNHRVNLTITYQGRVDRVVWVRDDVPQEFEPKPDQFSLRLKARSRVTVHYEMKASRRGAFRLEKVYLRIRSRLGLWQRHIELPVETVIHVYPDMKQLSEYAVLARTNRLSLMGVRRTRKAGQDNEFERLRDYTRDDNYKHIDWRATARRNKLTVKDFQTNQAQRLIFLLDCGRMMTNEANGLSLLDHSLNAMLMLSYVALRQGDSIGLICFSDEIHAYVPPRSGMNQMNHLLHASFDRFPRLVESRYDEAFFYLSSRCQKRSLVILVTNLIDEVNSNQVERHLSCLVGRHLPLGVMLRDHRLFDAADQPTAHDVGLFRAAAAAEILTWRHQVLTDLTHRGVLALDVFPEDMTAPLVNQYLDIKARHLL